MMDLWAEFRLLDMGQRLGRFIGQYRNAYFKPDKQKVTERVEVDDLTSPLVDETIGEADATKLRDDLELVRQKIKAIDAENK